VTVLDAEAKQLADRYLRSPTTMNFLNRAFHGLFEALEHGLVAEDLARRNGLLQRMDPRAKVVCMLLLILAAVSVHRLAVLAALLAFAALLGALSRVSVSTMVARIWIVVFLFSGILALPAIFITPGQSVAQVPLLGWTATSQGLTTAAFLVGRAEASATFSLLLILCTPWARVLKSLRVLGAPSLLVILLATTYRYIFVLLRTALDMFEARRSRMVGVLSGPERRRLIAGTMGVLAGKSLELSGEVHLAMRSRCFQGQAHVLDDFRMRASDWIAAAALTVAASAAAWIGR
jgi:cobalt/nickel transport system permease protein